MLRRFDNNMDFFEIKRQQIKEDLQRKLRKVWLEYKGRQREKADRARRDESKEEASMSMSLVGSFLNASAELQPLNSSMVVVATKARSIRGLPTSKRVQVKPGAATDLNMRKLSQNATGTVLRPFLDEEVPAQKVE